MSVAPQLRWHLIIKANSGLSASGPTGPWIVSRSQTRPRTGWSFDTIGKGAVVGLKKESCLDILQ